MSDQNVDDPNISTIEPDPYYWEETVGLHPAEESEDQEQSQS
jgi:hypothetical protein